MHPPENYIGFSQEDRDRLIRLEEVVRNLVVTVDDMKDDTKLNIADHETRIRALERNTYIGLGALAVGEFLLNYFHPFM